MVMLFSRIALLTFSILLVTGLCMAGENRWTPTGLSGICCYSFTFHPSNERIVFGTGRTVWRSRDGGKTWNPIQGLSAPRLSVNAAYSAQIRIHPVEASTVVLIAHDELFKSTNLGSTWEKVSTLPLFSDFEFHAEDSSILYATELNSIYKSTNGGSTWFSVFRSARAAFAQIEVDRSNGEIVYAYDAGEGRIYKSLNGGKIWKSFKSIPARGNPSQLIADPIHSGVLYAGSSESGVSKSTNGGESWFNLNCDCSVIGMALGGSENSKIYVANYLSGNFRISTDAGFSWTTILSPSRDFPNNLSITASPLNPELVLASTDRPGVIRSTDSGGSWTITTHGTSGNVNLVKVSPSNPRTIFAAGATLLKSTNNGRTWNAINKSFPRSFEIIEIQIHPSDDQLIGVIGLGFPAAMGISQDGGSTWRFQRFQTARSIAWDPINPNTLYAGSLGAVSRSTDQGVTWDTIARGFNRTHVQVLSVNPSNPQKLLAGMRYETIFLSNDGGFHWKAASGLPKGSLDSLITGFAYDATDPNRVYVSSGRLGVFRSDDGGASWIESNQGLPEYPRIVNFIKSDPRNQARLFTGGGFNALDPNSIHLYVSDGRGAHWRPFPYPARKGIIADMAISSDGTFYLATSSGVYSYTEKR
jgi:photosystem II stability/assembly factor-like uncharacterized protein